jgi:hypothetical protein
MTLPPRHTNNQPLARKSPRYRGTYTVAGAYDEACALPLFSHWFARAFYMMLIIIGLASLCQAWGYNGRKRFFLNRGVGWVAKVKKARGTAPGLL